MPADFPLKTLDDSRLHFSLQRKITNGVLGRLRAIGNINLLDKSLVGFFCSKRCPGEVILRVYDLTRALRDAGVTVIGGFHSPMEKECLTLLLRGEQPIVICPARSIENMRLPTPWKDLLKQERLLIISLFEPDQRRPTAKLAQERNHMVAAIADVIIVPHAASGSRTERLCLELSEHDKLVYTLNLAENGHLIKQGILANSVEGLLQKVSAGVKGRKRAVW